MFMCEYCSTRKGKECDVCLGVIVCDFHKQIHEQSQEHKYHLRRILKMQVPLGTKSLQFLGGYETERDAGQSAPKDLGLPQSHFDMFSPEEVEWMERESDVEAKDLWYATSV